eukprot:COSAG06_NODE_1710_length_8634_cov_767.811365_3_plen_47_part_00
MYMYAAYTFAIALPLEWIYLRQNLPLYMHMYTIYSCCRHSYKDFNN